MARRDSVFMYKSTRNAAWGAESRLALSPNELAIDMAIERMARAVRLRAELERRLREFQLSFTSWWVLYVTRRIEREADDAVSQRAISARSGVSNSRVSQVINALALRELVECEAVSLERKYAIWVRDEGHDFLDAIDMALSVVLSAAAGESSPTCRTDTERRLELCPEVAPPAMP